MLNDQDNWTCEVQTERFAWGFSYLWLTITVGITSSWLFGLWVLWIDADHNSQFCRKGRRMGHYHAVLDIANALREELGQNTGAYSEEELYKLVKRLPLFKYHIEEEDALQHANRISLSTRPSTKVQLHWNKEYK